MILTERSSHPDNIPFKKSTSSFAVLSSHIYAAVKHFAQALFQLT